MKLKEVKQMIWEKGNWEEWNNILSDYEDDSIEKFEDDGDLEELFEIAVNTIPEFLDDKNNWNLHNTHLLQKFVMNAQMNCRPEDLYEIPKIKEFRNKYPKLYRAFEVWSWG